MRKKVYFFRFFSFYVENRREFGVKLAEKARFYRAL